MNGHDRYLHQAAWTRELRSYLFKKTGLSAARSVLEVGCGTGAILQEVHSQQDHPTTRPVLYGLDISSDSLIECQVNAPDARLILGDALSLPFPVNNFDISYCHFLLLWVKDPLQVLIEIKRVTRSQGYVLALAEPDYSARQDRPSQLASLGLQQTRSLEGQGADVSIGSRIADLFSKAGIRILETGPIKSMDKDALTYKDWLDEWETLETDLAGLVEKEQILKIKQLDEEAWRRGEHLLNVPTYFVWGQV